MATSTNPFSEFLNPGNITIDTTTAAVPTEQKFITCLVSGGFAQNTGTPALRGLTGSGLYSILRLPQMLTMTSCNATTILSSTPTTIEDRAYFILDSSSFLYPSVNSFIGHLNAIHNNANDIIRGFLASSTESFPYNAGYRRSSEIDEYYYQYASASIGGKNVFLFVRDYLLPNSYTGDTGGNLPFIQDPVTDANDTLITPGIEDLTGNGITGAFVTYDSPDGVYRLSRTGIEFYTILNALAYGAMVIVTPTYKEAADSPDGNAQFPFLYADSIMSLDMGSYLTGKGLTSGSDVSIYGGLIDGYASGNTYNFCHGSSAFALTNSYGNVILRNNIFNCVTDSNNAQIPNVLVIHAGLSGSTISLNQSSTSSTYSDVYRHPSLDGKSFSYQYQLNTAGLTSGILSSSQLDYTFCVIGKKTKTITTSSFGDSNNILVTEIPLVSDVVGALARSSAKNELYLSAAGYGNGKGILNADSVTPLINPTSTSADILKARRVNYYSASPQGAYLASDYVGATGPVANTNRLGVAWVLDQIDQELTNYLNSSTTGFLNQPNIDATRTSVKNSVINYLNNTLSRNIFNALDTTTAGRSFAENVKCDRTNNPTDSATNVQVDVTVYPKLTAIFTDSGAGAGSVGSFTITVSAGG